MTAQEIDRIQNAINHIKSSVDIDPWAMEIAVKAMEKQIPKPVAKSPNPYFKGCCPTCGYYPVTGRCEECGQVISWR